MIPFRLHTCSTWVPWRAVTFLLFTNPTARAGYDTRSIFKRSLTGLNSEFSFSLTSYLIMAEEPSLPYYLPIVGGRIIGFIPFPRVLMVCEMQSVSSRIWTRVTVSISYDVYHYSTSPSCLLIKMWQLAEANGVTRNEPKIHVICYITICLHTVKSSNSSISNNTVQRKSTKLNSSKNCQE